MKPFSRDQIIDGRLLACIAEGIEISRSGITFDGGLRPEAVMALYRIAPTADALLEVLKLVEEHEGVLPPHFA